MKVLARILTKFKNTTPRSIKKARLNSLEMHNHQVLACVAGGGYVPGHDHGGDDEGPGTGREPGIL
mgnify:CR=1 FL=1